MINPPLPVGVARIGAYEIPLNDAAFPANTEAEWRWDRHGVANRHAGSFLVQTPPVGRRRLPARGTAARIRHRAEAALAGLRGSPADERVDSDEIRVIEHHKRRQQAVVHQRECHRARWFPIRRNRRFRYDRSRVSHSHNAVVAQVESQRQEHVSFRPQAPSTVGPATSPPHKSRMP